MTELDKSDQADRRILEIVQQNNQLTHAEIGQKVALSESAVRRRIKAMRAAGIIARDVSILKSEGLGVRLIVTLSFDRESPEIYDAFDRQISKLPEVLQAYYVSGSLDYVLIVHGPSIEWYEAWSKATIMSNLNIRRYDTHVVWSCRKFETAIPV